MKVSAFIPVTNAVKRGDTFIEAIVSHLFWADEVVVVDGGSTDGTVEKIQALNDPRIRIEVLPWPQDSWSWDEFPKHWNFGLEKCTGDWVAAGESDHIFHENEASRLRHELEDRVKRGFAICAIQKLQSLQYEQWFSKGVMYYFINKKAFPNISYGFDPEYKTDLCQPIVPDGGMQYGLPTGKAIAENSGTAALVKRVGPNLYNYLWTFKTVEQVINERLAASAAWNRFEGFTEIHEITFPTGRENCEKWIIGQLRGIESKINRHIDLGDQPKIMQNKIKNELVPGMIGAGAEEAIAHYLATKL